MKKEGTSEALSKPPEQNSKLVLVVGTLFLAVMLAAAASKAGIS